MLTKRDFALRNHFQCGIPHFLRFILAQHP
ncbi:Uncharacterised protein [Vibrio cholerae]|nr:Uncharacterised protein [Vibrio cholerae]